ncbi:hypothetical protein PJN93_32920, partial [Mycobacterium kansasii]
LLRLGGGALLLRGRGGGRPLLAGAAAVADLDVPLRPEDLADRVPQVADMLLIAEPAEQGGDRQREVQNVSGEAEHL